MDTGAKVSSTFSAANLVSALNKHDDDLISGALTAWMVCEVLVGCVGSEMRLNATNPIFSFAHDKTPQFYKMQWGRDRGKSRWGDVKEREQCEIYISDNLLIFTL
jgi:hypothetical protein